jgi:hypothetical protein
VALGRNDLDVLEADALHLLGEPCRRSGDVCIVLGQGGDGGNAQERLEFVEEARVILAGEIYSGG